MKLLTFARTTYHYSPLRTFEDETLRHFVHALAPSQRILDLGGGKKSDYAPLFFAHTLDSLNISEHMQPTFVADLTKPLPVADSAYDQIISMNTLEHIPSLTPALPEAFRILTPGGTLFLTFPSSTTPTASPTTTHDTLHHHLNLLYATLVILTFM